MDAAQALGELMELSSQIEAAVVLGADGGVIASSGEGGASLAGTALELVGAAAEFGSDPEVTRVEIELAEGALFVVRERDRTIAARTGPEPASGLVVYDLRTCIRSIEEPEPKKKRASRAKADKREEKPEAES
jgi:predicted regulator of Ras-like GTPase activity (Roadblock/LC7/MglB family)